MSAVPESINIVPQNPSYSAILGEGELSVTPAARVKMAELLAAAESDIKAIRVFVTGGGCSGMSYGMTYTDQVTEYDRVIEDGKLKVVVDTVAINYLAGAEIDFMDGPQPSFVFNNVFKNVGGSGGCGAGGCGAGSSSSAASSSRGGGGCGSGGCGG